MNRNLWTQSLSKTLCPSWTCPECKKGTTSLMQGSVTYEETENSRRGKQHEAWDYDWITYVFTAHARCNNASCKQLFAISGHGGLEPCYDEDGETAYEPYFSPQHISPTPDVIEIPATCPDDVKKELRAAFRLMRADMPSCANRLRVALECLMNHIGIQKRKKGSSGFYDLTLHKRIELYEKGNPTIGAHLMAIKWLGNAGSHEEPAININDLLDAFEVLEHCLVEILEQRSARIAKLAKDLGKKHKG